MRNMGFDIAVRKVSNGYTVHVIDRIDPVDGSAFTRQQTLVAKDAAELAVIIAVEMSNSVACMDHLET